MIKKIIILLLIFSSSADAWTITSSTGANGSISPLGAISITEGDSQLFIVTPNNDYEVALILLDGISIGPSTKYTFDNVVADHTISVTFQTYQSRATAFVMLKWDYVTDPIAIGYKLYYGKASRDYSFYSVDVGNVNQYALTNIVIADPIYFAVTAYSVDQESGYSNELHCGVLENGVVYEIPWSGVSSGRRSGGFSSGGMFR
jgi:hypothetical protein